MGKVEGGIKYSSTNQESRTRKVGFLGWGEA